MINSIIENDFALVDIENQSFFKMRVKIIIAIVASKSYRSLRFRMEA
jgi:hypothetical protein